ncbi:MAG: hypothetical protein AAF589_05995 [Planctomycetota bacterium]
MQEKTEQLDGHGAVRDYVAQMLCSRDNLEAGCFELTETPLVRGSSVCAIYFCLHGPRLLRLTAIWETETNTILFYGSQGERFLKTTLSHSAIPASNAA